MEIPHPQPGLVVRYNFIWSYEKEVERENASKARPCAIVTSVDVTEGRFIVTVAPLTHSHPDPSEEAVEVPPAVKRMLGLDAEPSWIIASELNRFEWPGPDLERIHSKSASIIYGQLPRRLLLVVLNAVLRGIRSGRTKTVWRTE